MAKPKPRHLSRRQFLKSSTAIAGGLAAAAFSRRSNLAAAGEIDPSPDTISIYHDPKDTVVASPPVQWAIGRLADVLRHRGMRVTIQTGKPSGGDFSIVVFANVGFDPAKQDKPAAAKYDPEAFALMPSRVGDPNQAMMISAGDPRGLVYALTELTDRVESTPLKYLPARAALNFPAPLTESPANPYRGIVKLFASEIEDKPAFYDRDNWQAYLDMLVTHRFNTLNLSFGLTYDFATNVTDTYTYFLYPFLLNVPGYNVRALNKAGQPLPTDEQAKNLDTLKFISDQCARRGLNFTLGIWTHNFTWTNSPNATYTIDGLNAQTLAPYSRDALKLLIDACPNITGITLRTHGESGVPEGNYDLWKIIMAGLTGHKNPDGTPRLLQLDLHAKSITKELIDIGLSTGMPLSLSCKLWAEHMGLPYVQASIRESEMPKEKDATGLMALSSGTRSFLRYGIGDLLTKDRKYKIIHRIWPGTQKLLLWGDPLFAAEYGRTAHAAGTDGIDFFEPLSFRGRAGSSIGLPAHPDRSGYADDSLRTKYDWQKYAYTFRLWGRLAYNPDAPAETWQRQLTPEFDAGDAKQIEELLANTSRILPLLTTAHDPAAAGDQYWPECYTNQSICNPNNSPYSEAPTPKVFGNLSPLDPQLFSTVNEYVDALLSKKPLAKISPLDIARQLDTWTANAARAILNLGTDATRGHVANFRRYVTDASIASALGTFFAHKFRAAIFWQLFNLSAHEPARTAALDAYKKARLAWGSLADHTNVYLPNLTFGSNANLRGHWSDRLPAIDADIASLATATPQLRNTDYKKETIDQLIQFIINPPQADVEKAPPPTHKPPALFRPGEPLQLWISEPGTLFYRHFNQGERWQSTPTTKSDAGHTATIPATYTQSPFPLQYYYALNNTTLFPNFKENFTGTPYFTILPA